MKSRERKVCAENVINDVQCQYYSQNWGWGGWNAFFTCYRFFKISTVACPTEHNFEDKIWRFTWESESNLFKFCSLRNAVPHFKTVANCLIQINIITVWDYKNKRTLKRVVFQFYLSHICLLEVRNIIGYVVQSTTSQENVAVSMSLMSNCNVFFALVPLNCRFQRSVVIS